MSPFLNPSLPTMPTWVGGIDLMDQHHAYYPVGHPSVKWWRYVCWWLFQSAMINAYNVFKETQKQQGQPKNHEAHQIFLAGCSACLVCRQICETEGTCAACVYGGCHSITPSFTCCLQVSWQEAKLFSVPEQQAPYTKGIRHSVELWMSSVLCSPVQSPMLCSVSSSTGTAALNRYMCELYRCEL